MKIRLLIFCFLLNFMACGDIKFLKYVDVKTWDFCITSEFLNYMKKTFNSEILIETGTYKGFTCLRAKDIFSEIHTVEITKEYYEKTVKLLREYKNIQTFFGNSALVLKDILDKVDKNKKILFWLDAHHSGGDTGMGDYEVTKSMTPILEELESIYESKIKDFVIMIDDMRLFGQPFWPTLKELKDKINTLFPEYDFILYGDVGLIFHKKEDVIVKL